MRLPIFPLGIVLFPDQILALHIFEDRYKRMTQNCLDNNSHFVIVKSQGDSIKRIGCTAEIHSVINRYEDGRLDILVRGLERVLMLDLDQSDVLLHAKVEVVPDIQEAAVSYEKLSALHMRLLELKNKRINPQVYASIRSLSYFIAKDCGLSRSERQALLEMSKESERQVFMSSLLVRAVTDLESRLKSKSYVGRDGHFHINGDRD